MSGLAQCPVYRFERQGSAVGDRPIRRDLLLRRRLLTAIETCCPTEIDRDPFQSDECVTTHPQSDRGVWPQFGEQFVQLGTCRLPLDRPGKRDHQQRQDLGRRVITPLIEGLKSGYEDHLVVLPTLNLQHLDHPRGVLLGLKLRIHIRPEGDGYIVGCHVAEGKAGRYEVCIKVDQ